MKNRLAVLLVALGSLLPATWAGAESMDPRGWGARVGARLGDDRFDQILVGAHADLGDIRTNLRFAPNATLGFGSDATIVSLNPDIQYVFRDNPLGKSALFYLGGGLGVDIIDFHEHNDSEILRAGPDESETQLKVNLVAGIENQTAQKLGYFGELRVSFVDGTWIELLGGVNFLH